MSKLVSILTPAFFHYNSKLELSETDQFIEFETFLCDALISCTEQTYSNIEMIVLGSRFIESANLLDEIKDPRIKFVFQTEDKGIAASRNELLKLANGEYIAWLDADDEFTEDKIKIQVEYLNKHTEIDLLGSGMIVITSGGTSDKIPVLFNSILPKNNIEISDFLWYKNYIYQPTIMSRNFYVKENIFYDETFGNSVEDYELWYRIKNTKTFHNLPQLLTIYSTQTSDLIEQKRIANNFYKNLSVLWAKKWKEIDIIGHTKEKTDFINFLYQNARANPEEIESILFIIKAIESKFTSNSHHIMCSFLKLKLWKKMEIGYQLKYWKLALNILKISKMKKLNLIGNREIQN